MGLSRREGAYSPIIAAASVTAFCYCCFTSLFVLRIGVVYVLSYPAFALFIVYLTHPASAETEWYDFLPAALGVCSALYIAFFYWEVINPGRVNNADVIAALVFMALMLEASRRVAGFALPCAAVLALLYCLFGNYLPGTIGHRGFSLERTVLHLFYSREVFQIPRVAAEYVFVFSFLGAVLEEAGFRGFINDLCFAVSGGNPAAAAAFSPLLTGGAGGSSLDAMLTNGEQQIIMMEKAGYAPRFSGALAAVSACAGQFAPPVMGVTAFMAAMFGGFPYVQILRYAFIPVAFFYIVLAVQVFIEPRRYGRYSGPLPSVSSLLAAKWFFFLPVAVIIVCLAAGLPLATAGFWGLMSAVGLSFLSGAVSDTFMSLLKAVENGARRAAGTVCLCAVIGIISGVFSLSGLGLRFSNLLSSLAGFNLYAALFISMCLSLLLCMTGLPAVASFCLIFMTAVPLLLRAGCSNVLASLSVFSFCAAAELMPRIIKEGADMSGAGVGEIGLTALRLAAGALTAPYIMAFLGVV